MIDGIGSNRVATFAECIETNSDCSYDSTITRKDLIIKKYKCDNLTFDVIENQVRLRGSIHKYSKSGDNSSDFTRTQLIEAFNNLWHRFRINPYSTPINSLEIGINIKYSPRKFIDAIIDYKGNQVRKTHYDFLYSESQHNNKSRYYIKAYDKNGFLRIELHFNRMADINKKGVKYFSDITTTLSFEILGNILLKYYDNYLIFDNTDLQCDIKPKIKDFLLKGQNQHFWEILRRNNPENYKKKRFRFKELTIQFKQCTIKNEVRQLIEQKINQLCEAEKSFPELTTCKELLNV